MKKSRTLEERLTFIRGLHRRLEIEIEAASSSERVEKFIENPELQAGLTNLAREQRITVHKVKLSVLKPFLSEIDNSGFLESDINYVDWCSGRGFLAYLVSHFVGAPVTMIDIKFPKNHLLERYFPCILEHEIPKVKFNLTTLKCDRYLPQMPEESNGKTAYMSMHCCGSLPDLIVRYAQLQSRMPDLIAILPCHYEKMEFELSALASKTRLDEKLFSLVKRAVAYLQHHNGYHPVARKSMEVIDYFRAENLRRMGYDAKVVRIYHPNVSPFNHMIIGLKH
ncbi:hypothetical protein J4448_01150 [Candidatus Woesearchaeota archaeon]|nr:hypothetical protein [Candidatus Woesearchaeota archaeon]